MVYGILLASAIQFILEKYDKLVLKQVQEYLAYDFSNLNPFGIYDDRLMLGLAEGMKP